VAGRDRMNEAHRKPGYRVPGGSGSRVVDGHIVPDYDDYMKSPLWKLRRTRFIDSVDHRCESCGRPEEGPGGMGLDVHHEHYDTLGDESQDDVTILCRECHVDIHEEIGADRIFEAGLDTFGRKKYGNRWAYQVGYRRVSDEFNEWLDWKADQ